MSQKVPISILIMTKNEELNISHCLESVKWADEIIVVDSHSTDKTLEITKRYTDKIYQYEWDGKQPKKSWSLEVPKFSNDWILMLDADERATLEFKQEIESVVSDKNNQFAAYTVRYHYWFLGKYIKFGDPVRKLVLFRKSKSHFEKYDISGVDSIQDLEIGHEHPIIDGIVSHAKNPLLHADMRTLHFYFDRHNHYSTWEAFLIYKDKYKTSQDTVQSKLGKDWTSSRRLLKRIFMLLPFKSFIYFVYAYIFRLGFLDGYAGLAYNVCKAFYAFQIGLKIREYKMKGKKTN